VSFKDDMLGWTKRSWLRIKALAQRRQLDRDLDDELAFHMARREQQNRDAGLDPREAHYAARRQFGNFTSMKERSREMWTFVSLEALWQDLRYAVRTFLKVPGFTSIAVLTLALGIGANTAIFSVVDAILLRPLPYPEPHRLVRIWESSGKFDSGRNVVNPFNFLDWREHSHSFEAMAAMVDRTSNLSVNGQPVAVQSLIVSPAFFSILRVPPFLGRTFIPEDGIPGQDKVVILSYSFWRDHFGSNSSAIGQQIDVDGVRCPVIGVMPQNFSFPKTRAQVWLPLAITRSDKWKGGRYLMVVARLKPGFTPQQAQQDMLSVAKYTVEARPDENKGWGATVVPMLEDATEAVSRPLWVLLASVAFLLLIACSNVANLLLMRGTARLREMAVRSALGAARSRMVCQLLLESLLLSFAGMALGLFLANAGLHALLALIPENAPLPRSEPIAIDTRIFLFTFLISLITAIMFGLVPALRLSRVDVQKALAQGTLRSGVGGSLSLRRSFVIAEVALALLLAVGAGLMLRSFVRIVSVDPGFDPAKLVTMHIWTSPSRYHDNLKRSQYIDQILTEIRNSPGVLAAGSVHFLPLTERKSVSCFSPADQPAPTPAEAPSAQFLIVSTGYFKAMNTSILSGRDFDDRDRFNGAPVAIVNQAFARQFSANQNILGRRFRVCWSIEKPVEIVGVVADARQEELQSAPEPTIFLSQSQAPMYFASIVVRAQGDPRQILRTADLAIHRVDPDQAISDMQTMETVFSSSVSGPRFQLVLLLVFAGIALALATIGIYGVVSYSVSQRTQEIGIRVAVGASAQNIIRMVMGEAMVLGAIAVGTGLAAALALTRVLRTLLFEVSPTDPVTLLCVCCAILLVCGVAAFVPARRAMRVDPLVALRCE
jgi:putative ABC transport system permease protein